MTALKPNTVINSIAIGQGAVATKDNQLAINVDGLSGTAKMTSDEYRKVLDVILRLKWANDPRLLEPVSEKDIDNDCVYILTKGTSGMVETSIIGVFTDQDLAMAARTSAYEKYEIDRMNPRCRQAGDNYVDLDSYPLNVVEF